MNASDFAADPAGLTEASYSAGEPAALLYTFAEFVPNCPYFLAIRLKPIGVRLSY